MNKIKSRHIWILVVLLMVLFDGGYAQASVTSATTDKFAFYFYNRDHLGSIREVVDASGKVKQVTNYYPFGAPYADSPVNPDHQPYKYNGKELDRMHGLNTYDYGARQYYPILCRWDRVDPLCEKYYAISPYAYCNNNPVRFVDPDGRDVWELDEQGNLVNIIKTDEYDRISYVNSQGEVGASIQFDYGMVSHETVKSSHGDYDMFTIRGDENGSSVFEMLAQNTDVEWTLGQFGEKGIGINRITTTHSNWSEGGMNSYLYANPSQVKELRNKFHNHPDGNPDPSFTSREGGIGGDMNVLHYYDKLYPDNHINYAIYTLYVGTWGYYPYDKNTKPDAIRGKQTELPEIFVSGTRR